ncbi:hypothetical protein BBP00_00008938 [Phytophthora kernoviae]|uniref:Alkaline phosphatase n=2 Tax=Phytophthora kernoviae TaxID=325452 RepID=A0A3F2REC1_9STRA|nr:hypothetical protein BBP00_00008938 [Phytophthora kernoviae]
MGEPPMRMGLVDGKAWPDVYQFMETFEKKHVGRRIKLVILLRHGEATHNATKARVGDKIWEEEYENRPEFIDAPLTSHGQEQADSAAVMLEKQIAKCGLKLQRIFVSPLDRTLQTYDRVFARLKDIPVSVVELARETLGVVQCDRRKIMAPKQAAYPKLDFNHVASENDTWWKPDHRETNDEISERAAEFLKGVFYDCSESLTAATSRFRYSPGFFIQGEPSHPLPEAHAPRMGLKDGKTWQDVQTEIDAKNRSGTLMKLVVLLRHGEGTHNVAIEKYGSDAWNAYYCKLPVYIDAPLTLTGIQQAETSSLRLNTEINSGLQLQHVLISPLERTLRTYTIVYQNQTAKIPSTPLELPREVLGVDTCDERRSISEKRVQYPDLDFSGFDSDADPWWTSNHRETDNEINSRASKFLDLLFYDISAKSVGVVSHSVFGAALLRVIGHREYSLGTAEFLPLLIEELISIAFCPTVEMTNLHRLVALCTAAVATVASATTHYEYKTVDVDYGFDENEEEPRSVIMMIPDGTGPNIFTLARTVLDPSLETRLHIDPYLMGTVQTHSSTSYITDSASSATAYSTGFKTYDAAIAMDTYEKPLGTVLEAAKARGMVTGMIVTSRVTHATPASFAAHVIDRDSEDDIAAQYVASKNLDFLLGGGKRHFNDSMLQDLEANGYSLAYDYQALLDYQAANVDSGALRVFGLFHKSHMTYEVDRAREQAANDTTAREPSLPEMVDVVLDLLRKNEQAKKHGYFLMIEGSRVDHAGHSNDPGSMAKEAITFDETFAVVLDHLEQSPNTAMLSAADHGTGGLTLGRDSPYMWYPTELQQQNMSTEIMQVHLEGVLDSNDCSTDANETCKTVLLTTAKTLLANYTNVTSVSDEDVATLVTEIATAVDETRDLEDVMIELGHVISVRAAIGWTTIGHVGTDVNLYCKGPQVFERMCKGLHENTYLNKIMTNFLGLEHQQDLETLKHRNFTVLEDPLAF